VTDIPGAGRAALVVLAGGSGSRVGAELNKVYLPLAGRRVISWSFLRASRVAEFGHFVLVVRPADADLARRVLERDAPGVPVDLVIGGTTRHDSEQAGLDHLAPRITAGEVDIVAVHDGARPLADPALFRSVVVTARLIGGALPALPADGVLAVDAAGLPTGRPAPPGLGLARVQTPQAFRARPLLDTYRDASAAGYQGTDTASSVEAFGDLTVRAVVGSRLNIKITYPADVALAERLLTAHGDDLG
jgi:2-C-methyl-D-erythritol 4-phosphate cytidylyltransferase